MAWLLGFQLKQLQSQMEVSTLEKLSKNGIEFLCFLTLPHFWFTEIIFLRKR